MIPAEQNQVWKALADPTRREILDLLAEKQRSTGELCEHFAEESRGSLCRTGVMKHLDQLEKAHLVVVKRDGRMRWNHLNPVPIQAVCERWVSRHVRQLSSSLLRLKQHVEENPESPKGPKQKKG